MSIRKFKACEIYPIYSILDFLYLNCSIHELVIRKLASLSTSIYMSGLSKLKESFKMQTLKVKGPQSCIQYRFVVYTGGENWKFQNNDYYNSVN